MKFEELSKFNQWCNDNFGNTNLPQSKLEFAWQECKQATTERAEQRISALEDENKRLREALEMGIDLIAESAPLAWASGHDEHAYEWEKKAEKWMKEIAQQALVETPPCEE